MMRYRARLEPDGEGFLVRFPALPEAITGGDSVAEAIANAIDALEVVLLTYAQDGKTLPADDAAALVGPGERLISPSAAVAAKIAFIEAFRASGLTRTALAAQLGKGETEIRRMLDPYFGTKLPALEAALLALGKRLVVTVEAA